MQGTPAKGSLLGLATALLLAGLAQADEFWQKKPPRDWTVDEALKLVLDSPWAHEEAVIVGVRSLRDRSRRYDPFSARVGRRGFPSSPLPWPISPPTAAYLVRWESATMVAEAFTRLEELGERTSALFQAPPPRLPDDRYVITVKTTRPPPGGPDIFDNLTKFQLRRRAQLKTKHGTVLPREVERSGLGASAAVHFFFPRTREGTPLVQNEREVVEFRFEGNRSALGCKFKLEAAGFH